MKNKILLFLTGFIFLLTGCRRDDDFGGAAELQPIQFVVNVKYDAAGGNKAAANAEVSLKNVSTGEVITGKTNNNGELVLPKVLPGTYDVLASITLNREQYFEIFGITTNKDEVSFNGSQEKVVVNANNTSVTIVLANGVVGDFVIKQYYYAGSDTTLGALFRDQFVEIHNNSNQILYADGLYIAFLEGNTNNTVTAYTLPSGQFDWSKSPGNESLGMAANTDYVYATCIIKIPGSGTDYPILPGQSFVVAQTAINHKAPFTNNSGVNVSIQDPSLTVDLSGAEFEAYLGDYMLANGGSVFATDIQNPAVPDVKIVTWDTSNKDLLLNSTNRPAVVIFKDVSDAEFTSYPKIPKPTDLSGYKYKRLPKRIIMDGVDTTNKNLTAPKDLPNDIDAGRAYIQNAAGEAYADYTSYAVIRKTKEIINGRVVLQDTNNSTNDFVTIKANPKGYAH